MKYCSKCGKELFDEAVVCVGCGCSCATQAEMPYDFDGSQKSSGLKSAAKIFMILGTVIMGLFSFLIPLAWCIPMTVSYYNKVKRGEPISVAFKVCCLLFVSSLAGILMLVDRD